MKNKSLKLSIDFKSFNVHILYLFIVIIFSNFNISAQQSSGQIDSLTLNLIRQANDEKGKETGALIILKDYKMTVNEKSQTKLVLRVLGKVYTKEAMLDYSQIPVAFNSFYEEPVLNYARVIHRDGTVREVPKDAIQIKTTPEFEGLQYTDQRYLSFALSGMEPGAVFDYQLSFIQNNSVIEGEWFENHLFSGLLQKLSPPYIPRIDPVLTSRYTLLVPAGTSFQYHLSLLPVKPEIRRSIDGQDEYTWIVSDLKPIMVEGAIPPLEKLCPVLVISSLKNWSQLDQWASNKILSKVEVTAEITRKVSELILGKNTQNDKIKSISDFIQNNIQYVYADINRGGFSPHTVGEILNSRYGDCKDQAVLLISMLKAAGIESYPALINPYPYPEITELPTPYFSHLITNIPADKGDIWLDMTSGVTPFPNLLCTDQNRMAFLVNGKGGKLIITPVLNAEKNLSTFDLLASYEDGKACVRMKLTAAGAQNDLMKSLFKSIDAEAREQSFRQMVSSNFNNSGIDSIIMSDVQNPELYFSTIIKYHLDSTWQKGQEAVGFGSHALIPLGLMANMNAQDFPEKRYNDLVQYYSYSIRGSERYVPPENDLLPLIMPQNDSIKNEFFSFGRSFLREGNVTVVSWSLTCYSLTIPKDKYQSYLGSIKRINELSSWTVNYIEPISYINHLLRTEKPEEVLGFCNGILKQEPNNILALLLRGQVYSRLNLTDQSLADFMQATKLFPENKYAYLYIAFPLMTKKNSALALKNINLALKLDPEFEEAYLARGMYYADQALFNKALDDINMTLKLNPKHLYALQSRGNILSRQGKYAEAAASYKEVLGTDSTNYVICSILAETYLSLNLYNEAIEMYIRAILLNPSNYLNYGNLGWTYYLANDDQKCIEYSQKALALNPSAYYVRFNIALATLRSGNVLDARKQYHDLKKQSASIPDSAWKGGAEDLNDLMGKGIYIREIKEILKEYF